METYERESCVEVIPCLQGQVEVQSANNLKVCASSRSVRCGGIEG